MIRFSAALVAVAIGMLIAGIAASKLLLVYVAIVLSAVALVVLAIGVLLKRDELFGEGQGLAPAQAGASPVLSDHASESDRNSGSNGQVTPPLPPVAAVGPGAAFAGHSQAAFPQPGRPQSGGTWEAQTGRGSWASPATAAPPATRWQEPAPSVFAPRPVGTPPAASGTGPGPAAPKPGPAAPDWFNSSDKGSSAEAPATPSAPRPQAGGNWSWLTANVSDTPVPEDKDKLEGAAVLDEDDDWPTRYSWLEDEPEESGETSGETTDDQSAEAENDAATPATADLAVGTGDLAVGTALADEPLPSPEPAAEEQPTVHLVQEPDHEAQVPEAPDAPGNEPPATTAGDAADVVTVIRGVPRFHRENCVLIRFMPEGDTQKLPVAEAREAGCTPCSACEPQG